MRDVRGGTPFLATRTDRAIIALLLEHEQRLTIMTLNVDKITAEVAVIENSVAANATIIHAIADEVKALRSEGGGALQNELDMLAARLHASADVLAAAAAEGTAAESDIPAPAPSVDPGAAQAAADALKAQDNKAP